MYQTFMIKSQLANDLPRFTIQFPPIVSTSVKAMAFTLVVVPIDTIPFKSIGGVWLGG
jgi:hypothetical protein